MGIVMKPELLAATVANADADQLESMQLIADFHCERLGVSPKGELPDDAIAAAGGDMPYAVSLVGDWAEGCQDPGKVADVPEPRKGLPPEIKQRVESRQAAVARMKVRLAERMAIFQAFAATVSRRRAETSAEKDVAVDGKPSVETNAVVADETSADDDKELPATEPESKPKRRRRSSSKAKS